MQIVPLYAACIEDLGPGDFVKVDCAGCSHTALLAPGFLDRLGLSPRNKVLDLKDRVRGRVPKLSAARHLVVVLEQTPQFVRQPVQRLNALQFVGIRVH